MAKLCEYTKEMVRLLLDESVGETVDKKFLQEHAQGCKQCKEELESMVAIGEMAIDLGLWDPSTYS